MIKSTAVDLFSGCGGLTLGLKEAGFNVLGAVEIDPVAIATYRANHPEVHIFDCDIRILTSKTLMKRLNLQKGELSLLAGCPPCQGFSAMRTHNGAITVDDYRNKLINDFLRIVNDLFPQTVMMENVPGLANNGLFHNFTAQMAKIGYQGQYRILDTADYGVPQRRRRLIYMAGRGFRIDFAFPDTKRHTVRDTIAFLPKAGNSGDPLHDIKEHRSIRVMAIIGRIPKDGGSRRNLPEKYLLNCHKKCSGFKDVYGRMSWDDVAPTITSGCFNPSKGRFLHPEEDRAITMREAALLQGFPIDYKFPIFSNKSALATIIGNAFPPIFVCKQATQVISTLKRCNEGIL
ncbi:MAG: DNA cytosine methyltransferase [Nitrospirae bacterium]|nr:DNA cytosine methyltransferase [Nitrospirota bacterium]